MEADRENPKTEHEKTLYQNITDAKGLKKMSTTTNMANKIINLKKGLVTT